MACVVGSTNGLGDSAMMIRGDAEVSNQINPQNVEPDLAHWSQAGCKSKTILKKQKDTRAPTFPRFLEIQYNIKVYMHFVWLVLHVFATSHNTRC